MQHSADETNSSNLKVLSRFSKKTPKKVYKDFSGLFNDICFKFSVDILLTCHTHWLPDGVVNSSC
jgi:hypothetical protein